MRRQHRIRTTLLAALITFASMVADATERVYKWTDSEGVVHFGQQPPTEADAEAIKVQNGFSTVDPDATAEPTDEEKKAAANAETCRVATENFKMLSGDDEVRRADDYGETHVLTPEEKASERARAEAAMKRFCP